MQTATVSYKYRKNHQQEVGDFLFELFKSYLVRRGENSIHQRSDKWKRDTEDECPPKPVDGHSVDKIICNEDNQSVNY